MSAGPNGWKHVRCARENETTPVRQKLPGPVLFFLNYKPEYVPNTICKPGIYATFSNKKCSPLGDPFIRDFALCFDAILRLHSKGRAPAHFSGRDPDHPQCWSVHECIPSPQPCSFPDLIHRTSFHRRGRSRSVPNRRTRHSGSHQKAPGRRVLPSSRFPW